MNVTDIYYDALITEARLGLFGHLQVPSLTPRGQAPVSRRRTLGVPEARSSARSHADCMASQARAVPTPAASRRIAKFGELRACSWRTRLSVTRNTPSRSAASLALKPHSTRTSSRRITPGCTQGRTTRSDPLPSQSCLRLFSAGALRPDSRRAAIPWMMRRRPSQRSGIPRLAGGVPRCGAVAARVCAHADYPRISVRQ